MKRTRYFTLSLLCFSAATIHAAETDRVILEPDLIHLRSGQTREWSEFPETAQGSHIEHRFRSAKNDQPCMLGLRQIDVKQTWRILLNGKKLGDLIIDENDMAIGVPIPPGGLSDGENVVKIEPANRSATQSDDIRIGQLFMDRRSLSDALGEGTVEIRIQDADLNTPIPGRITIWNRDGSLQQSATTSGDHLAIRPGIVFTSTGMARIALPAGDYTIFAGRGFEYSLDQTTLTLAPQQSIQKTLAIRREVPTEGYVACDTHVHTLTFSGHGDATIDERMITLAGEGIELPIATDHNVHVDYEPHAQRMKVRDRFTPVVGNEVTTAVGHFNVFPVLPEAKIPDNKLREWSAIFDSIYRSPRVKAVILNHARDLHSNTRPFGPKLHNALVGENLEHWPMRFNAMEVVNSGATQTDSLQLFRDWMGLLNRGYMVTPVGSSDSHDVGRHFVGQGRTYIRCDDRDVSKIDIQTAVDNFVQGRVLVSYGLLAELTVAGRYKSGEFAAMSSEEMEVEVRVLGPHWVNAETIQLYANGLLIREEAIPASPGNTLERGVKWKSQWKLPKPPHDVHLVAIALGPGVSGSYWKTAKSYQPVSPDWTARVIGCSGAMWIDGDGDGRRSCAHDYASRLFAAAGGDLQRLVEGLKPFDAAVAAQVAHVFRTSGGELPAEPFQRALKESPSHVSQGFRAYFESWRENELARAQR